MDSCPVRVALRVRPLNRKELNEGGGTCVSYIPDTPQIVVGTDRAFTYDHVFQPTTPQEDVYMDCVDPLVQKFLAGFHATVFAYGQTGSGKTYSMGTSIDNSDSPTNQGIIPRAVNEIFMIMDKKSKESPHYKSQVLITFLELYNEELLDLLNPARAHGSSRPSSYHAANGPTIREDPQGGIYWKGVEEVQVNNPKELMDLLYKGLICRTTASTDMNLTSSRSHAIFSITLKQVQEVDDPLISGDSETEISEIVVEKPKLRHLCSKFHFVDLAGSERLKKTNAVGGRAKEGISINAGLLALGNVISALGDETRKSSHIPYRNSKLTRLLQDSIGGNSQTLMLACISPSDVNFLETLNTLKYANRARNIKNRVQVNQDMVNPAEEISRLKSELAKLKLQLLGSPVNKDMPSVDKTKYESQVKQLQTRVFELTQELTEIQAQRDQLILLQNGNQETNGAIDFSSIAPEILDYTKLIGDLRIRIETLEFEKIGSSATSKPQTRANQKGIVKPKHLKPKQSESPKTNFFQTSFEELQGDSKDLEAELEKISHSIATIPVMDLDDSQSDSTVAKSDSGTFNRRKPRLTDHIGSKISSTVTKQGSKFPSSTITSPELDKNRHSLKDVNSKSVSNIPRPILRTTSTASTVSNKSQKPISFTSPPNSHGSSPNQSVTKDLELAHEIIKQQETELTKLKLKLVQSRNKRISKDDPHYRPLSYYPNFNESKANTSKLRALYKKKLLEQEVNQFLMGRRTRKMLSALSELKERLLGDLAELEAQKDTLIHQLDFDGDYSLLSFEDRVALETCEERLEEAEANLSYTLARIKSLEMNAETNMSPSHNTTSTTHKEDSNITQNDLYGEGNYRAALKILYELEPTECGGMMELLLKDLVSLRMSQWHYHNKVTEQQEEVGKLQLFIQSLRNAAEAMTINYEDRLAELKPNNLNYNEGFNPVPQQLSDSDQEYIQEDNYDYTDNSN